ncbi:MAG: GAF and ANTAR domain-containing protein [Actinomycetota bacterium]|nr:GAF and ANTAR domain-containing protein [Actinomycetota bacterium]
MDVSQALSGDLAELSQLLLEQETLETALRRVADLAVASVGSCDACGVSLLHGAKVSTSVATHDVAQRADDHQYRTDEGPCLQAVRSGKIYKVDDMTTEKRWPRFAPLAAREGVTSSYSLPLVVGGRTLGALNLYSLHSRFGPEDERVGQAFGRQAAIALANAQAYQRTRDLVDQLNEALRSRDVIGQAKGILMAREAITADAAFERLRRMSQSANVKVRTVAQQIVDSVLDPSDGG